ncbi:MAG: Nif3-like dinuclear metal center hexameric protein [Bacteroidales bacterium]|nr:Nif3-like dinuclear metal center hexameric protein [Bacteroidales bacterium]
MILQEIISLLEETVPAALQENYDNSGLIVGDAKDIVTGILLCVDVTEEVIDEAILKKTNLIISHHPIIFGSITRLTGNSYVQRCAIKAVRHKIALYTMHTNLDNVNHGVSHKMALKLGLKNITVLAPLKEKLVKLVFFTPVKEAEKVRMAIFKEGAGVIGPYDCCSFNVEGQGTFRPGENTNPYVGAKGEMHTENEVRTETIMPNYLLNKVLETIKKVHPYEEVAYDAYPLLNTFDQAGTGALGSLEPAESETSFLEKIKLTFNAKCVRHTRLLNKPVKKVALCGGSGSQFLSNALKAHADIYISSDFKYHQFFDADNKLIIADIGHYESEQHSVEIIYDLLTKKITNFAVHFSSVNTNPINYF